MGIIMKEIKGELNQVIEEINEISVYIYQQDLRNGLMKLDGTLGNIMKVLNSVLIYAAENNIQIDQKSIISNLTAAMQALEEKDYVLLADILLYEIAEQFHEILTLL